ncbi:MAG TPA: alcohol dehydrogenase catalytic domain-containing protein [Solirubrobacteraceae bacterium]|nr:alcohol dehydrogenase catalytic domain-containing protein [Solirubrobacteraceae bacterium]
MVVTGFGEPLEPADLPEPSLRPGTARLEILTCGVCFSDVKTARGKMPYSSELPLPHVCGHEICARVLETDPAGALEPGTLVVVYHVWPCRRCDRCRAGVEQLCRSPEAWTGFTHPGGFEEQLVAPLDRLAVVPEGIDPVHAAPLTCALGTAYRAVLTRGGVTAGTRVVVIGLGGVGIHALQIAHVAGARATGTDLSERALDVARSLDLEVDEPLTEGDVVVDTVGTPATIAQAEQLVRPGGRIVLVGYGVDRSFELPSARFVLEEVEVVGSRYVARDELERAIRLVADGRVQTVVDRVLPLEQANEAFAALEAGEVVGRVVLEVAR